MALVSRGMIYEDAWHLLLRGAQSDGRLEGDRRSESAAEALARGRRPLGLNLALNSLKQWVVAEQGATDRYLLGGAVRNLCREATDTCLVTGGALANDSQLHHPVRDGRPPIPLSKEGHAEIEGQTPLVGNDSIGHVLLPLRRERNQSWAHLRRGCLDLLGRPEPSPSKASAAGARAFARKAGIAAGIGYEQILEWMDSKGLGRI